MKNANDMEVLVMTLRHRPDRYWYMLGMLDARRFIPKEKCHTVMGKYWKDYKNLNEILDAMIKDGFPWAERLRDKSDDKVGWGFKASLWSACRCLRYIASQDKPYILTEDDYYLIIDRRDLIYRLKTLPEDTEIAILDKHSGGQELYNDYWMRGWEKASGGTCVVYAPTGAQKALEIAEWHGITWENIGEHYPSETTYCVNGDEPLYQSNGYLNELITQDTSGWYGDGDITEFKGYGHHSLYDRWVDGLNVKP